MMYICSFFAPIIYIWGRDNRFFMCRTSAVSSPMIALTSPERFRMIVRNWHFFCLGQKRANCYKGLMRRLPHVTDQTGPVRDMSANGTFFA